MKKTVALALCALLILTASFSFAEGEAVTEEYAATGVYTFYNKTGETVTELYLINNLTDEKGDNYAEEGFAPDASLEVSRGVTAQEKEAGYSMTVYFKTEGGYEARFATLHIEEVPVTLLAADAMTGATPISFFAPIEAVVTELENAIMEGVTMDPVEEAVVEALENATVEDENAGLEGFAAIEAVVEELENAFMEGVTMEPVEEAVVPELAPATIQTEGAEQ